MSVTDSVSNKTLNQVLANSSQAKATDTSLAAASKGVAGNSRHWAKMRSCNCWSPS
jgi:flagellar basal-body rod modification protein FlgD